MIEGSDLIARHGLLDPVIEDADLWKETDQCLLFH